MDKVIKIRFTLESSVVPVKLFFFFGVLSNQKRLAWIYEVSSVTHKI